ncbi:hypothetical protein AAFC00_002501 [Neodothiora populina]|uniref:Mediator complex subunit 15 KIX domain-containing protein n=1 Tax=Neodothiora populina TaxID=2781224 RepID=A0ABR3P7M0_9PEZI
MDPNPFMMAGNMLPQGMQRPQPGNENDQIHAKIMEELRKVPLPNGTWHITMDYRERANWIMQLQSSMRLLQPQHTVIQAIGMALRYEVQLFQTSPSKDQYTASFKQKLQELQRARQAHAMNNNNMMQAQNNFQMSQGGIGMQTPMQQTRSNQGVLAGNMIQQPQQPFQNSPMNMAPQPANMQTNLSMQQRQMQSLTQQEKAQIQAHATQMINGLPKPKADLLRHQLFESMPLERRQQHANQDPLPRHMFQISLNNFLKAKAARQQAGQGLQGPSMDGGNAAQAVNMQRPGSQQGLNGNPSIDFASFAGQQADAMKMQESGQLVVPASTNGGGNGGGGGTNNNNTTMDPSSMNMNNMNQPNLNQPGMINNNPAQVQNMMVHRQQQLQRDAAMRTSQLQAQAQAQARNAAQAQAQQQNMLRGQGLNATQPPQQSPAMSMLNRPMIPPGQQGGTTPQQPSQQNIPQVLGPTNPALMASLQSQNMNGNQSMFPPQKLPVQIPDNLPPQVKAKLMGMDPDQARLILERMRNSHQANQAQGMQNGMNMPNGDNINPMQNLQQNGQQGPNVGNVANMNQVQIQQRLIAQQQQQQRLRAMDPMAFPRRVLQELQLPAPDAVQTWGQLRQFVQEHQATLPPDSMPRMHRMQSMFAMQLQKNHMNANANGLPNGAGGQLPGSQPTPASGPPIIPGTQAPPAQMVPQQQTLQNQGQPGMNIPLNPPNMSNAAMLQVSPQEMQAFRARMNAPNAPDEHIKAAIMKWKINKLSQENPAAFQQHKAQYQAQQNAIRQAQLQRAGQANMAQQPGLGVNLQAPGLQNRAQPPFNMQAGVPNNLQGPKRPGTSDDVVEIPNPNQSPQRPPTAVGQPDQAQMQRPTFDQLRTMTPEQLATLPAEQKAQLSLQMQQHQNAQQRAQVEALKRAQNQGQQQAGRGPNQGQMIQQSPMQQQTRKQPIEVTPQHRVAALNIAQQADKGLKKGAPAKVDNGSFPAMIDKLKQTLPLALQTDRALPIAVAMVNHGLIGQDVLRRLCMLRTNFFHQMHKNGDVHEYVSLNLKQLEDLYNALKKTLAFILHQYQQHQDGAKAEQVPAPAPMKQPEVTAQPQPPQNLHQRATENMSRSASQGGARQAKSKAPPAPTSTVPPFPIGSPRTGHGVPVYEGMNTGLTPDKLHLPPQKKRKGNNGSAASTPANQGATPATGASPQLMKAQQSPGQRRQQQLKLEQQQQQEQERRFKCADEYCEFSVKGFEKEEELQAHTTASHPKIEDPLEFFLNSAANALDVDVDGQSRQPKADSNVANKAKPTGNALKAANLGPVTVKREALKIEGQTPGKTKQSMTPSPGFVKPSPPASGRTPQAKSKPATTSEDSTVVASKTMLETMADRAGIAIPKADGPKREQAVSTSPVVGEDAMGKDESPTFVQAMADALVGLDNPYGDDMEFSFPDPSPALTPSSSQSGVTDSTASSANNINENDRLKMTFEWDPYNIGSSIRMDLTNDIGLGDMGLQSCFDNSKDLTPTQQSHEQQQQSMTQIGQESAKNVEDAEKGAMGGMKDMPMAWDTMFYPGAGLEKDNSNWDRDAFGNSLFAGTAFF